MHGPMTVTEYSEDSLGDLVARGTNEQTLPFLVL